MLDNLGKFLGLIQSLAIIGGIVFGMLQVSELQHQNSIQSWVAEQNFQTNLVARLDNFDPPPGEILRRDYQILCAEVTAKKIHLKPTDQHSKEERLKIQNIKEAQKLLNFYSTLSVMIWSAPDTSMRERMVNSWRPASAEVWNNLYPVMDYSIKKMFPPHVQAPRPEEAYPELKQLAGK